jgi:hypothetical protein
VKTGVEEGRVVGSFVAGAVAIVVGGALAFATALGVVSVVSESPDQSQTAVVDYGTNP